MLFLSLFVNGFGQKILETTFLVFVFSFCRSPPFPAHRCFNHDRQHINIGHHCSLRIVRRASKKMLL